jgi:hypothetical protein
MMSEGRRRQQWSRWTFRLADRYSVMVSVFNSVDERTQSSTCHIVVWTCECPMDPTIASCKKKNVIKKQLAGKAWRGPAATLSRWLNAHSP